MDSSIIYLDNAATTFPKPPEVYEASNQFLRELGANPGRGGHRLAVKAEQMLEETRVLLNKFFNGTDPRRMIFTLNTTDGLNIAIKGFVGSEYASRKKPIHVITSVMEHNSVSRPLEKLKREGMIELSKVIPGPDGVVTAALIEKVWQPNTRLVALSHASNVTGVVHPLESIGRLAKKNNAVFLVDAAQTAGIFPVDVRKKNIDLLAFPGHKSLLAYPGSGGLYVGEGIELIPWREGGTGGDSKHPVQPSEYPFRLEGGTPNTIGIASLRASVRYLESKGIDHIHAHEVNLANLLEKKLRGIERVKVIGREPGAEYLGVVAFTVDGYPAQDLGAILDDNFGIAVRCGLHCAPYTHQHLGTYPDGTARASVGFFNTHDDIAKLVEALEQIASA